MTIDMAAYMAARRENRRRELIALAGDQCAFCGSAEFLEFNHKDRTQKSFVLSGYNLDKPWQRILEEFAKCEVLCKDCHRRYTREQWDNNELTAHNKNTDPHIHGTMRMYQEAKCKCELCKQAKHLYRNKKIGYNEVIHVGRP